MTQTVLRYEQYQHYMKNKSNKYDFMNLSVMEKYPYPAPTLD